MRADLTHCKVQIRFPAHFLSYMNQSKEFERIEAKAEDKKLQELGAPN